MKITHTEFKKFIFSQPRDRRVNMLENVVEHDDECGCMMVQYARNKGLKGIISAGFHEISVDGIFQFKLNKPITEYFPFGSHVFDTELSYGEVQDFLIEKGEKIPKIKA